MKKEKTSVKMNTTYSPIPYPPSIVEDRNYHKQKENELPQNGQEQAKLKYHKKLQTISL